MKRLLTALLSITMIAGLVCLSGCGSDTINSSFADQQFINDLSEGLEARWDKSDQKPEGPTSVEEIREYIQLELDEIESYETAKFNDQKLRNNALAYIEVLHESYEHADYALSDENYELWQDYEKQRRKLLQLFMRDNDLSLSGKHQDDLEEYVERGETTATQEAKVSAIANMLASLEYKEILGDARAQAIAKARGEEGPATYVATFTNTTNYHIIKLTLDLRLINKDGKVVDNHGVTFKNLKPGDSSEIKLTTDKDFVTIQNGINSFTMR